MPQVGDDAIALTLPADSDGKLVSLSDFKGKKIVLYFYPKDDTPGCTREACDFRDNWQAFKDAGAEIIGISPDNVTSHQKFKKKYELPFILLEDSQHKACEAYGVWKEKSLYGRTFMGVERTTFVINEQQKIIAIFNRVQVDGHFKQVLEILKSETIILPSEKETKKPKQVSSAIKAKSEAVTLKSGTPSKSLSSPGRSQKTLPIKKDSSKTIIKEKKKAMATEKSVKTPVKSASTKTLAAKPVATKAVAAKTKAAATKTTVAKPTPIKKAAVAAKKTATKTVAAKKTAKTAAPKKKEAIVKTIAAKPKKKAVVQAKTVKAKIAAPKKIAKPVASKTVKKAAPKKITKK